MTYLEHLHTEFKKLEESGFIEEALVFYRKINNIKELSLTCGLGSKIISDNGDILDCDNILMAELENVYRFNMSNRR
ncbi:MAG: hypothetical protein ACRC0G_07320 [Fusobacteriaceae bacterium]